jgi:hypothetical protein
MAIKMRVNGNKKSKCENCSCEYKNTAEMYDLQIADVRFMLCKKCVETLFQKTLKASCIYNAKLKNQEDMQRLRRESKNKKQN